MLIPSFHLLLNQEKHMNALTAPPSNTAPADAVRLHIDDTGGGGRPVVLIHGWPLSAQAWEPQVSVLQAAGYRVVAYDRRGFGRSDKPESGYSYDVLADDLQRVMDQCGLQDVTLVGFSMGGGEVARYIARHGESRLRSVVFAAAVPPYLMKTADNPEGPLTPEKAKFLGGADPWLVARALATKATVVTLEMPKNSPNKVSVVDACANFKVPTMKTWDLLALLKVKFVREK